MRLHHKERDRLLQAVMLGMALMDKATRETLDPADFDEPMAGVLAEMQKPRPNVGVIDRWADDCLGVIRDGKQKFPEAMLARLKRNADLRQMQKENGYEAIFVRMAEVTERRKRQAANAKAKRVEAVRLAEEVQSRSEKGSEAGAGDTGSGGVPEVVPGVSVLPGAEATRDAPQVASQSC